MTLVHIALSIIAAAAAAWLLVCRSAGLNFLERLGFGLIGSGLIMAIGPVISGSSPFDLWAAALLRVGVILLVVGWARGARARERGR